jgi:ABC-type transport system substrate-binding protein
MRASLSQPKTWLRWCLTFVVLPVCLAGLVLAQDKKDKGKDDEETPKSKTIKKPPMDDEESKTKPIKNVPKDDTNPPVKPRPTTDGPLDLQKEASQATNPDLQKFYLSVAYPYDRINLKEGGLTNVTPVALYIGDRPNTKKVTFRQVKAGQPDKFTNEVAPEAILSATHFEQIVMSQVKEFLDKGLQLKPGDKNYLSRLQQLMAADKALSFAYQFHHDARAKKLRDGPGWDGLQAELITRMIETMADEIKGLIVASVDDPSAGATAAELADHMGNLFPSDARVHKEILLWKLDRHGNAADKTKDYVDGAQRYLQLAKQFPLEDKKLFEPVRERLMNRAKFHLDEAKKFAAQADGQVQAIHESDLQMKIWPETPGAQEFRTKLLQDFRMLVVGVRQLPELMSPALAQTDADRWAAELLFEGLIQCVPDASVGRRFKTQLAESEPRMVPQGREFRLPFIEKKLADGQVEKVSQIVWARKDGPGTELKADAIKETIRLLQENKGLPVAEGIDMLKLPQIQDPARFTLLMERGTFEPLLSMDFKILPVHLLAKPAGLLDEAFARQPVGTGPYCYHGRKTEAGREYAVFKLNPAYRERPGHFGMPRIQEIRFMVTPPDPTVDLREGKIDMMLDVSTADLVRLKQDSGLSTRMTEATLPSRRIWILAVNHRKPELGGAAGQRLRAGLSSAIDREKIVKDCFKAGTLYHRALRGPFPEETWAVPVDPVPEPLYKASYAVNSFKEAKLPPALTIKCIDEELPRKACGMIQEQLKQLNVGVNVEVKPLSQSEFHKQVMLEHDYDLAYMPFDYQNELFSLAGILDPDAQGRGERNFLGYTPPADLAGRVKALRMTRDAVQLRTHTHKLFTEFNKDMPFVPLWQLDMHVWMNNNVQPVPGASQLDPLTIFDQIEEWRVNR